MPRERFCSTILPRLRALSDAQTDQLTRSKLELLYYKYTNQCARADGDKPGDEQQSLLEYLKQPQRQLNGAK